MLSMRDDEFYIDKVDFKHAHDEQQAKKKKEHQRIVMLGGNSESSDYEDEDGKRTHHEMTGPLIIRKSYIFSSVRAFYVNWPYVCFSGLQNYLLIVNVYDRKSLHRVATAQLNETIQVCETFISNTKDLFVVIKKDSWII